MRFIKCPFAPPHRTPLAQRCSAPVPFRLAKRFLLDLTDFGSCRYNLQSSAQKPTSKRKRQAGRGGEGGAAKREKISNKMKSKVKWPQDSSAGGSATTCCATDPWKQEVERGGGAACPLPGMLVISCETATGNWRLTLPVASTSTTRNYYCHCLPFRVGIAIIKQ